MLRFETMRDLRNDHIREFQFADRTLMLFLLAVVAVAFIAGGTATITGFGIGSRLTPSGAALASSFSRR